MPITQMENNQITLEDNLEIENIDQQLNHLWKTLAVNNKLRACLFNLVVYVDDSVRAAYFRNLVQLVIKKFPCRILFVETEPHSTFDRLEAEVSAVSSGDIQHSFACDQIAIRAAGKAVEKIPFILYPHILPDLPVHILWGGDPKAENGLLNKLLPISDRIIFDRESDKDPIKFAQAMLMQIESLRLEVSDVNWARLRRWRDAFIHIFHTEERLTTLEKAREITITYNSRLCSGGIINVMQATYLQAWISTQLGWSFVKKNESNGNLFFFYTTPHGQCVIKIGSKFIDELSPGAIINFELSSHNDHHLFVSRNKHSRVIKIESSSPEKCEIPVELLLSASSGDLMMMREILFDSAGEHYKAMLENLARME